MFKALHTLLVGDSSDGRYNIGRLIFDFCLGWLTGFFVWCYCGGLVDLCSVFFPSSGPIFSS